MLHVAVRHRGVPPLDRRHDFQVGHRPAPEPRRARQRLVVGVEACYWLRRRKGAHIAAGGAARRGADGARLLGINSLIGGPSGGLIRECDAIE